MTKDTHQESIQCKYYIQFRCFLLKYHHDDSFFGSCYLWDHYHLDGLVQERCNSIANALELRLSCTNPPIYAQRKIKLTSDHPETGSHNDVDLTKTLDLTKSMYNSIVKIKRINRTLRITFHRNICQNLNTFSHENVLDIYWVSNFCPNKSIGCNCSLAKLPLKVWHGHRKLYDVIIYPYNNLW